MKNFEFKFITFDKNTMREANQSYATKEKSSCQAEDPIDQAYRIIVGNFLSPSQPQSEKEQT